MPDLPTPQDAHEATLLSECWDAVLSYADLCTSGSASATRLATEAFTHGVREMRAEEAGAGRGRGRRVPRPSRVPFLLAAVRTTAASWEAAGQGHHLDPDLRLWLNSDKAARYTGPPPRRPLALRALGELQEADADLLWLAEVEALPLPAVARRLGLDPGSVSGGLEQARALFRDRCRRGHLASPMDAGCRSYARLLDAVTRVPGTDAPEDLSRHLATCAGCAEAAACLRLHGGGLPAALAGGVIGWGGLAYLERRRRAAEAGLSAGRADSSGTDRGLSPGREPKPRIGRTGLLAATGIVSVLALAVTLMPQDRERGDTAAGETESSGPVAETAPSLPTVAPRPSGTPDDPSGSPRATVTSTSTAASTPGSTPTTGGSEPEPRGEGPSPARVSHRPIEPTRSTDAFCHLRYEIVNEWPDGFQATVTVTSVEALDDWSIGWAFEDGQRVSQMWDGSFQQDGSRVTASAADYNRTVSPGGTFGVGFIGSRQGGNGVPDRFTLNGHACATVS